MMMAMIKIDDDKDDNNDSNNNKIAIRGVAISSPTNSIKHFILSHTVPDRRANNG